MISAFFTGRTGASEHQNKLDIVANNLANVGTAGFKTSNASFHELLHQRVRMPNDYELRPEVYEARHRHNTSTWNRGAPPARLEENPLGFVVPTFAHYPGNFATENRLRVGTGAKIVESATVMTMGELFGTDHELSVTVGNPRTFFAVLDLDGEVSYIRGDTFSFSYEFIDGEGVWALTNGIGEYVLNRTGHEIDPVVVEGSFIRIPQSTLMAASAARGAGIENINSATVRFVPHDYMFGAAGGDGGIFDDGTIRIDGDTVFIRLGVFTFDNLYGLQQMGGNRFRPTGVSGEARLSADSTESTILQFFGEASNVYTATEMVKVIQAQRTFQANLNSVSTADEIAAEINRLASS